MAQQAQAPVTRELAAWVRQTAEGGTSQDVRRQARRMLVDFLGVTVRGAQAPVPRRVQALLARVSGGGSSPLIGTHASASVPDAAFANATAAHALELDDGYTRGSVHPSAAVVPAVLAVAQERSLALPSVLDAIAVGTEVVCRVAAAGHPETYRRGFHNTPLAGVIGAAAGAACAMGLDETATTWAIGLSTSHSAGLFEFLEDGSDAKRIHPGKAARDGWMSAALAAEGVTGPATALEGKRGYFRAYTGQMSTEAVGTVLDGLGKDWAIMDCYTKPYACCRALHSTVDAALAIRRRLEPDPVQIDHIRVETYAKAAEYAKADVRSLLDAQMSLPVAVVIALVQGRVGIEQLQQVADDPAATAALVARVEVVEHAPFNDLYPPLRPARVTVRTTDGTAHEAFVERPTGEPGNAMSDADLERKFTELARPVLGEDAAGRVLETLREPWDAPIAQLTDWLRPEAPQPAPVPQSPGGPTAQRAGRAG